MAQNYAYIFAEIDDATHMCVGVMTTTDPDTAGPTGFGTTYIPLAVDDPEYIMKYYINGEWWVDAEATIPYISPLL